MSKTKFKDNCCRCIKAWNCYSRDDCKFEELDLERVFDDSFDDDKERSFQNIGLDGSPDDGNVIETFEFNPNRSFDERCDIVRKTAITSDMTYEERLQAQRRRYGL